MSREFAIIDVFSLLHRAFYAIPRLNTVSGEVTNAVYGLAMMLWRIFEEDRPAYIGAAIDMPAKTFRHERFLEYKANRKEMPDELRPQVERAKEFLKAFRIPVFGVPGYEADDVIGTLARLGEEQGLEPRIYTGDRDALQLASEKTVVILTKRGITNVEKYDAAAVKAKYLVTPSQFIDVKGLMGDSSDNIPGIRGIGEKTAIKLVATYGGLEGILAHLDDLPPRQQKLLEGSEEIARLSKELATIDRQVPVEVDWEALKYSGPDPAALRDLFSELEFHSLLEKMIKKYPEIAVPAAGPDQKGEAKDFTEAETVLISEKPSAEEALSELEKGEELVLLTHRTKGGELLMAVSASSEKVYVLTEQVLPELSELTTKILNGKRLVGHDLKGSLRTLSALLPGNLRKVKSTDFDLLIAAYLLNPSQGHHSMREVVGNHLGRPLPAEPDKKADLADYAQWLSAAAGASWQLVPVLTRKLEQDGLWRLFKDLEMPLAGVLGTMEEHGILVDKERLKGLSQELGEKIVQLECEIYAECGEEFNLNSPKQLGQILFEKMGLPPKKKTKTGYSTSAEVLEELALEYPFVQKILDYRQYVKLKTTYVDALAGFIAADGRIHTTFNQAVTATGRLSSTNPNLQNIPIRTEEGRKIREIFVAPPGSELVSLDYSQIELRVLAHLSGDKTMLDAFRKGEDIHTRSAREVFGVEEVTPELRRRAKAINFGIVYGISPFGLSRDTGISVSEAGEYINNYFHRYPKVKEFLDAQVAKAHEEGYVETIMHRRRYLPEIKARNRMVRAFAERAAMNTPIQGSAADIIKLAMLKVADYLETSGHKTKMLLQIHDELVFEVPKEELDEVVPELKRLMETAMDLDVPLVVDAKVNQET